MFESVVKKTNKQTVPNSATYADTNKDLIYAATPPPY